MIPIAGRIIGKTITGRVLGIVLAVVVGLIALLAISRCSIGDLQREIGAMNQQAGQCQEDNRHQTEQVNQCVEGFTALADRLHIEQAANAEAVLAAERRDRQREREFLAEQAARSRIYSETPDCEAWSVVMVCDEIAEHMQSSRRGLIDRWEPETDG